MMTRVVDRVKESLNEVYIMSGRCVYVHVVNAKMLQNFLHEKCECV